MRNLVKKAAASAVVGGAALFTAGVAAADPTPTPTPTPGPTPATATATAPATAPPTVTQIGLINVYIGSATVVANVNVDAAAAVVANACGLDLPAVNVLVNQVSMTGAPTTVCQQSTGPVTVTKAA
jgi:hypothetical protein